MTLVETAPLRVVVIAAGSHIFGAAHAPALKSLGATVVGIQDLSRERAENIGAEYGWPVYDTVEELLSLEADLAVVCSPHPLHAELVLTALDAGLHVLVEKPLAARASDGEKMIARAREAQRLLAVPLQHRFRREVIEAKRMLDEGALGRLHRVTVTSSYPKRSAYYTDTPWRGTWAGEGGGVLLNQGQHDVDVLVHLVGMPHRLYAAERTNVHPIETEDTVEATLEWENGLVGSLHVTSASALETNNITLIGSRASIKLLPGALEIIENETDFDLFAKTPGGHFDPFNRMPVRVFEGGGGTHAEVYADLFSAITSGTPLVAPADQAILALEVINSIAVSANQHQALAVPTPFSEFDDLLATQTDTSSAPETT